MAWFTCFWLEKIDYGDENWVGKWLLDPKNRLVLVLPELVVRRGQDLKRWFWLAESHSSGCICKVGAWKGHTLETVIFVYRKSFFFSSSRAGALEGVGIEKVIFACRQSFFSIFLQSWCLGGVGGLKQWFSLAENRFSIFLLSWCLGGAGSLKKWCSLAKIVFPNVQQGFPFHWGSGGWGCVCSTSRSRSQPSATVCVRPMWPSLWRVLQRGHFWKFQTSQLRFEWQAWHFVTFQHVS